jgi:hypothetical protein
MVVAKPFRSFTCMTPDPLSADTSTRLMIFGHPAHELALFGFLQRFRPQIVIITDGGSEERIRQSRAGLDSIGLEATYLNFAENDFYVALLRRDVSFFETVAECLRAQIAAANPHQIFCDAMEFYNPVHDITLPLVLRAAAVAPQATLFEVPLVYQTLAAGEHYEIQRIPAASAPCRFRYHLAAEELRAKIRAREEIYLSLRDQAGPEFSAVTAEHLAIEEIARAGNPFVSPRATGRELRYEWRARFLKEVGIIDEIITRTGHFIPIAQSLLAGASPKPNLDRALEAVSKVV